VIMLLRNCLIDVSNFGGGGLILTFSEQDFVVISTGLTSALHETQLELHEIS
jgi:hypothetical protein